MALKIINYQNNLDLNESQILRQWNVLCKHVAMFNTLDGPRVGDYVELPNGDLRRICVTHFDGDAQMTPSETSGSFNIDGGACDYSGTCGDVFKLIELRFLHRYKLGSVWFFKDGMPTAHSGIDAEVPMRIYRLEIDV